MTNEERKQTIEEFLDKLFCTSFERIKPLEGYKAFVGVPHTSLQEVRNSDAKDDYDFGWNDCFDEIKERARVIAEGVEV